MWIDRPGDGGTQWHAKALAWSAAVVLLAFRLYAAPEESTLPPDALAASIRILQTGDDVDCLRETDRLGAFGTNALPALFIAVTNRNAVVRSSAWRKIERIGIPASGDVISNLMFSVSCLPDEEMRRVLEFVKPVLDRLYAADSTNSSVRRQLGSICYNLAIINLNSRRNGGQTTNLLERSAELMGSVYRESGAYAEYAGCIFAAAEEELGNFAFRDDKQRAGKAYAAARVVWRDLAANSPTNRMWFAIYLALSTKMANCDWHMGQTGKAEIVYGEVEMALAAMTNRDDVWWLPASALVRAYDVYSDRLLANADIPSARRLITKACELVDCRLAVCPECEVGIPLAAKLNLRAADLCILDDQLGQAETFLAKAEAVPLSTGTKVKLSSSQRAQMRKGLQSYRTALERLDRKKSWREQEPELVASVFQSLAALAHESGYPCVTYAYSRNSLVLHERLASNEGRRYHVDLMVETMNLAFVANEIGKPFEAMTLASNALSKAKALLETATRKDPVALLGRGYALSMLARLNEEAGAAELAQQYKKEAIAAEDECERSGLFAGEHKPPTEEKPATRNREEEDSRRRP